MLPALHHHAKLRPRLEIGDVDRNARIDNLLLQEGDVDDDAACRNRNDTTTSRGDDPSGYK
jgi:hypothetical protein